MGTRLTIGSQTCLLSNEHDPSKVGGGGGEREDVRLAPALRALPCSALRGRHPRFLIVFQPHTVMITCAQPRSRALTT